MSHFYLSSIVALGGLLCFGSFSWAFNSHFRRTEAVPPGMKMISLLSLAGFVAFLIRLAVYGPAFHGLYGLCCFGISLVIFAWTIKATRHTPPTMAFDTDQPDFLLKHGPYRYVRHPFYLSYMVFWVGTAAATPGVIGWVTPAVMLAVYQHAASREEAKFATSSLAAAYAAYRRSAGMFLPRLSS